MLGVAPFEFVGVESSVVVLNVIQFLLLLCPPKVAFPIEGVVSIVFHPFADKEVFPQSPCVGSEVQRLVVAEQGVAHPIVIKVYLAAFFQFGSYVAAEGS